MEFEVKLKDFRKRGMVNLNGRINKPIFIIGCMRSGTTILADLLGRHPDIIHCPFELRTIWSKKGNVPMASPKTGDRKCPYLNRSDANQVVKRKLTSAFNAEMRKNGTGKSKNAVFLNKNPHLCNKLLFVDELFPDARFIWIYRHLPSVVASLKKLLDFNVTHYWPEQEDPDKVRCWHCFFNKVPGHINRARCFPGGDVAYLAEYWYETNRAVSEFVKTISTDRIILVQEEDLIVNPERVLGECMSFLGLPVNIPKRKITKLDPSRNNSWRNRLTTEDLQSLSRFVSEYGERINAIFPNDDFYRLYQQEMTDKGELG